MAFDIPADLNPSLAPLAWLIGSWSGGGHCEYPNIERYRFMQEVVFNHDKREFLTYYSRMWRVNDDDTVGEPLGAETGFWRVNDGTLEVLITQSSGQAQGWVGRVEGPRMQLVLDHSYTSPNGSGLVSEGNRLYGLVEGELFWAYDMAADGYEMQPHMWATLKRDQ